MEQVANSETQLDPHGPGLKTSMYLAFGAAGALLKYVEETECMMPLACSLHVELIGTGRYVDQVHYATMLLLVSIIPPDLSSCETQKFAPVVFTPLDCGNQAHAVRPCSSGGTGSAEF